MEAAKSIKEEEELSSSPEFVQPSTVSPSASASCNLKVIEEEQSAVGGHLAHNANPPRLFRPSNKGGVRERERDCPPLAAASESVSVVRHHPPRLPISPPPFQNGGRTNSPPHLSLSGALRSSSPPPRHSLGKVKRFLTTLVQFGQDISQETGDRVKTLVISLVSGALTVEEFHHSLQEVTNFPLRPFVLPFLRAYLPPLQRDISTQARTAKLPLAQYLRQHENAVLDPASFSPGSEDSSEIFSQAAGDAPSLLPPPPAHDSAKRRPSSDSYFEMESGGIADEKSAYLLPPAAKRAHLSPSSLPWSPSTTAVSMHHFLPPTASSLAGDYVVPGHHSAPSSSAREGGGGDADRRHPPAVVGANGGGSTEEEWKNIHMMLNCILSMVEKTKRALGILQQRMVVPVSSASTTADATPPPPPPPAPPTQLMMGGNGMEWATAALLSAGLPLPMPPRRAMGPGGNNGLTSMAAAADDVKRTAGEIMAHTIRLTEDRVAEVRRKAEEAVNEVKRQAVAELQRAVAAAESKACELVAAERAKMERLIQAEAVSLLRKKKASGVYSQPQTEDAETTAADDGHPSPPPPPSAHHNNNTNTNSNNHQQQNAGCWNCGRKANETCSGCNTARYCGSFCQHKDWETHHHACGTALHPQPSAPAAPVAEPSSHPGVRPETPSASSSSSSSTSSTSSSSSSTSSLSAGVIAPPVSGSACSGAVVDVSPPPPPASSSSSPASNPSTERSLLVTTSAGRK